MTLEDMSSSWAPPPSSPRCATWRLPSGRYFTDEEIERKTKVVVLGSHRGRRSSLATESAVGQYITVGTTKLAVIGVLRGARPGGQHGLRLRASTCPITLVFQKFTSIHVRPLHGRQHPHDLRGGGPGGGPWTTSSCRSNCCWSSATT